MSKVDLNVGILRLSQGMTSRKAKAILMRFDNSISTLASALEADETVLDDISYTTKKGEIKYLKKKCIRNLIRFFTNCDNMERESERDMDIMKEILISI